MEGGGEAAGSAVRVVAVAAAKEVIGGIGGSRWDEAVGPVGGPAGLSSCFQALGAAGGVVGGNCPGDVAVSNQTFR
ncbi:hypothetical protein BDZ91DRAFT_743567 [Kalaharituber pfeilii]|nr:hypothetical protein BDZ91DRAFT_743567 [Kalaharituber pfeilii]